MRSFTGADARRAARLRRLPRRAQHGAAAPRRPGPAAAADASSSPPPWGTESISYERFAQPVLDRYCVHCHQGKEPGAGGTEPGPAARAQRVQGAVPDAGRAGGLGQSGRRRTARLRHRRARFRWRAATTRTTRAALTTLRPMQYLSYKSRLIELAASGKHYDVQGRPAEPAPPDRLGRRLLPVHGRGGTPRAGRPGFPRHRAPADPPPRGHRPGHRAAVSQAG